MTDLAPLARTADGDILGVTPEPLTLEPLVAALRADAFGATACFIGTVRSPNRGRAVRFIEYEGYEAMIVRELVAIAGDLHRGHAIGRVAMVHRLARLAPGEASIAIVVASGHRRAALDACSEALELCKQRLPVWKYEVTDDGGAYVRGASVAGATL